MEMGNEQLQKSLVDLIDETISEIEELKKSKFAASEISIHGPGNTQIGGAPTDGKLDAKKADDGDEDEEDESKEHEDKESKDHEKKEKDMEKAEVEKACSEISKMDDVQKAEMYKAFMAKGVNEQADPGGAAPNYKDHSGGEEVAKGVNEQADPGGAAPNYKDHSGGGSVQKSKIEEDDLMKSFNDRVAGLEDKISNISEMIAELGERPVGRRSVPAGVTPLTKNDDDVEPLSKSAVIDAMWELKKSGEPVDTLDFAKVETGTESDLYEAAAKYKIN